MPRAPDGTVTLPAGNPVVTGTAISSTVHNATMTDIQTMLEDSLSRSGKGGMASPFPHADGSSSAPGITFDLERGSGLYRSGAGTGGLSVDQVVAAAWTKVLAVVNWIFPGSVAITGAASIGGAIDAQSTLEVQGATTLHTSLTTPLGVPADIGGNLTVGGTGTFGGRVNSPLGYAGILSTDLPAMTAGAAVINDGYIPVGIKVVWTDPTYTIIGGGTIPVTIQGGGHSGGLAGVVGFDLPVGTTFRGASAPLYQSPRVAAMWYPGDTNPIDSSLIANNQFVIQTSAFLSDTAGENRTFSIMFWYSPA